MDPNNAVVEVENYAYATSQLAQTTLRSVFGQAELDELLAEREKISVRLQIKIVSSTRMPAKWTGRAKLLSGDLPQEKPSGKINKRVKARKKKARK